MSYSRTPIAVGRGREVLMGCKKITGRVLAKTAARADVGPAATATTSAAKAADSKQVCLTESLST